MSLRPATAADAAALASIQEEASKAGVPHVYPPELYPFPTEAIQERWRAYTARGGWVVLHGDDGFVAVDPPWLEAMYVRPGAWGSGVADALHDAAVAELRARGVGLAWLWTLEENHRARRFYERHGWQVDGETRVVEFPPHPLDVRYAMVLT